jgi:hypothetical protein
VLLQVYTERYVSGPEVIRAALSSHPCSIEKPSTLDLIIACRETNHLFELDFAGPAGTPHFHQR